MWTTAALAGAAVGDLAANDQANGLQRCNFGSADQPYALDIFDRSALGLVGPRPLRNVKMGITLNGGREGLYWNDNSRQLRHRA